MVKKFAEIHFIKQWWNSSKFQNFVLFGLVLIILRFFPFIIGNTLYFGDNFSLMVPGKLVSATWLSRGLLPLWSSDVFAGITWVGDINQTLLYFSTLLFLVLPTWLALNSTILLHVLFSFLGMTLVLRKEKYSPVISTIGALLWVLSQQFSGVISNISNVQTLAYLPWVVLCAQHLHKHTLLPAILAIVLSLQLSAGYPQYVLYSLIVAGTFSLRSLLAKKVTLTSFLKKWSVTAVLFICLSAAIWLPFMDTLQQSTRSVQTTEQALTGSLYFHEIIQLMHPTFFNNPSFGMRWGPSWSIQPNIVVYVGVFFAFILLLRLKSKRMTQKELWLILGVTLPFLLSFGARIPGFELIRSIPLLGSSRGISSFQIISSFYFAVLGAELLSNVKASMISKKMIVFFVLGGVLSGLVLGVSWLFPNAVFHTLDQSVGGRLSASVFHTVEKDQVILVSIFSFLLFTFLFAAGALWALSKKRWTALVIFIFLDLVIATQHHVFFTTGDIYNHEETGVSTFLHTQGDLTNYRTLLRNYNAPYTGYSMYWDAMSIRYPFSDSFIDTKELTSQQRLREMKYGLTPNWNQVYDVPSITGYTTLLPQTVQNIFGNSKDVAINRLPVILPPNPLLNTWSVKYYIVDTWFDITEELPDWPVVFQEGTIVVYENPDALSRFRYADSSQALELATFYENPNKIEFQFENTLNEDFILIADRYDKYWTATVNGQDVPIENYSSMRKVPVQPGENTILLVYKPTLFFAGLAISAFTVFLLALWVYRLYWYPEASEDFSDPEE